RLSRSQLRDAAASSGAALAPRGGPRGGGARAAPGPVAAPARGWRAPAGVRRRLRARCIDDPLPRRTGALRRSGMKRTKASDMRAAFDRGFAEPPPPEMDAAADYLGIRIGAAAYAVSLSE